MLDFIPEKILKVLPIDINFGAGSVEKVGEAVRKFGARPLVVIGKGSAKDSGALDSVAASIEKAGLEWELFEGVEPDPSVDTVARIIDTIKTGKHDIAIGLGGGSAMDAAKVAARDARNVRSVAVTTTSGTGSEVTRYAVLSIPSEGRKYIQVDIRLLTAVSITDPALTLSCPPELTAVTGLDTLTHHIEGYFNIKARPGADPLALKGAATVMEHLEAAFRDGSDMDARVGMSKASLSGGVVIHFKPAGLPHGFSYSFYNMLPHGKAVATLLPYCWVYYAPVIKERSIRAAEAIGVDAAKMSPREAALAGAEVLWKLYEKLGQPATIDGVDGVDDAFVERAVNNILSDSAKLEATPRRPDPDRGFDEFCAILNAARTGDIEKVPN